ncbi:MAG: AMP-binding protein [Myxococcota bacterium]
MLGRMLTAFEEGRRRVLLSGLDAEGEILWAQTGEDLLARVGAWQRLMDARGVRPGDRVAVAVPRGPEILALHVAVLASGATVVPINPALSRVERDRILERADLAALLAEGDIPPSGGTPSLRELPADRPALLVFTSGTTGEPKGVPLTEQNLEANLSALTEAWGLRAGDRILHVLPVHHLHGLVLALYGSARIGLPILLDSRFDAPRAIRSLARHGATVFMGVPTMYHRMASAEGSDDLSGVRLFVCGSAPLSPADHRAFASRFGHRPVERYGLTETMIVTTNPLEGERRPGTVGPPLPGVEVRIAPDGEIEVRGPSVMPGYWQAPDLSEEAFDAGFFRTGDLGIWDDHGYLVISGRKKDLILVGGSNVLPGEVEHALGDVAGLDEIAVAGIPDADLGEVVGAFVVARLGERPVDLESRLRDRAEADLSPYKRPRLYRFVESLPRNAMGKIDRKGLIER